MIKLTPKQFLIWRCLAWHKKMGHLPPTAEAAAIAADTTSPYVITVCKGKGWTLSKNTYRYIPERYAVDTRLGWAVSPSTVPTTERVHGSGSYVLPHDVKVGDL